MEKTSVFEVQAVDELPVSQALKVLQSCTGIYMHIYTRTFCKIFKNSQKHIYTGTEKNVGLHLKLDFYLIKKHIYSGIKN